MHIYIEKGVEHDTIRFSPDFNVFLVTDQSDVLLRSFYTPPEIPAKRWQVNKYASEVAEALGCKVKAFDDTKSFEITLVVNAKNRKDAARIVNETSWWNYTKTIKEVQ